MIYNDKMQTLNIVQTTNYNLDNQKMSINDKITATENFNTILIQHQPLTLCSHFLLMLFSHLLTFSDGPDHSLEFVQYLEFANDHIPSIKSHKIY